MRHVVTALFFAGAIAAYIAGSTPGAGVLLVVGIVLELLGWYRVTGRKKQTPVSTD